MKDTMSKTYIAILSGSAGLTGALVALFLNIAWYVELPIAVVLGLLVGLVAATITDTMHERTA